jgi:hypothetical protein
MPCLFSPPFSAASPTLAASPLFSAVNRAMTRTNARSSTPVTRLECARAKPNPALPTNARTQCESARRRHGALLPLQCVRGAGASYCSSFFFSGIFCPASLCSTLHAAATPAPAALQHPRPASCPAPTTTRVPLATRAATANASARQRAAVPLRMTATTPGAYACIVLTFLSCEPTLHVFALPHL